MASVHVTIRADGVGLEWDTEHWSVRRQTISPFAHRRAYPFQADTCGNEVHDDCEQSAQVRTMARSAVSLQMRRIGKGLAVRAAAFGMKVIAFDKYWDEAFAAANGVARADIDTILRVSDFVSLHVPATADTENLIDAVSIATMKDGACIINTARGELIDEQALADAVKSGKLKAAAVDVTRHEPPTGSPLLGLENLLITPHIGANTAEAGKLMSSIAADNVIAVLTGSPCPNRVN